MTYSGIVILHYDVCLNTSSLFALDKMRKILYGLVLLLIFASIFVLANEQLSDNAQIVDEAVVDQKLVEESTSLEQALNTLLDEDQKAQLAAAPREPFALILSIIKPYSE